MSKQDSSVVRQFNRLEAQRAEAIHSLLHTASLLKGSLSLVKRTCGKPTCHCVKSPGHRVWVLATSSEGTRRCQVVRKSDVDAVRQRVNAYKAFRAAQRRLQAIQKEQQALITGLIEERHLPYE